MDEIRAGWRDRLQAKWEWDRRRGRDGWLNMEWRSLLPASFVIDFPPPLFFLASSSSGIKLTLGRGSQCLIESCLGSIVWLLLDPNADRLHTPLCLLPSERKCTHPRNNMLFDRAHKPFYPAEPGVGGGGEDLLFEKCPQIRLLCQKCFLWCSESPWLCEWGLRQRDVLALAYLFHTLFNSLVFLFSCRLCLPKPSAPLSARGVWWGSVDRDGWVKMCRWISAKPAEGWGRRDSLFFVDEKRHWISSTSAWHQGSSQAASSPWLY